MSAVSCGDKCSPAKRASAAGDRRTAAHAILEDLEESVSFSSINGVEFALKRERLLSDCASRTAAFAQQLTAQGFAGMAFSASDAAGRGEVKPNRDPFDRMLRAQAIARELTLLTADRDLRAYEPLQSLW